MNARRLFAAIGTLAILALPSATSAQTKTDDTAAAVQAPAVHQHDHPAATDASASKSCCAKMAASHDSHEASSATPAAQHEHDAAPKDDEKKSEGCCGGMTKNHQRDAAADEATTPSEHSCCCSGMMK